MVPVTQSNSLAPILAEALGPPARHRWWWWPPSAIRPPQRPTAAIQSRLPAGCRAMAQGRAVGKAPIHGRCGGAVAARQGPEGAADGLNRQARSGQARLPAPRRDQHAGQREREAAGQGSAPRVPRLIYIAAPDRVSARPRGRSRGSSSKSMGKRQPSNPICWAADHRAMPAVKPGRTTVSRDGGYRWPRRSRPKATSRSSTGCAHPALRRPISRPTSRHQHDSALQQACRDLSARAAQGFRTRNPCRQSL